MNCMAIPTKIGSFLKEAVHLRMVSFFFRKNYRVPYRKNLLIFKGGMYMFNEYKMFLGMLLKEANKVWKAKHWFWWALIGAYMFVDTYNSIWLYWIGEPVTAERWNQALVVNIMAGLVALIGVVQLYRVWKEER